VPKDPNAEQMREHRIQGVGIGLRSGQQPVSVYLPPELDKYVRSKPDRSAWLRAAIEKEARAEGWTPNDEKEE